MPATWEEIIRHSLAIKQHGKPYSVTLKELDDAVPKEFSHAGADSSIDVLNRALVPYGLVAVMSPGSYVKIDVKPD